ncbi:Phosphate transport system permease protein PstA [Labilithrix luteola]|uniref:Phosphate transport system permease protein PstA n=1 Tax=Labilithrix luteola TaxID=1391654 RepID=A0A0K1QGD0_9BACT|nr:phosphate ABC transporter permease PstA [Labilithrix luteola]AKV04824.1 Phosphate transport system permease protein PstA [Labilithrix luteola]
MSAGTLSKSRRAGRGLEQLVVRGLALMAGLLGGGYVLGLLFLVLRGGGRLAGFTAYPTPLSDIDGESTMRIALGFVLFGGAAWVVDRSIVTVLDRLKAGSRALRRGISIGLFALTVVLAVALRDHLPRFLISLPSETTAGGGIGPQIFNTLYFAVLSTAFTLPVGVGAAVYLARFAPSRRLVTTVRVALDTLASLPSIVYGLFGFLVFVVQMRAGYSLLAGAFVLAVLNLPLVVGITEDSLRAVPREVEEASLALGATQVQTIVRVSLPYAWPGILSALVLSVGRVFAESAPLIMTAGTTISRANAYSLDPMRGGETLAVHLWYVNSAGLSPDKADVSAGTAAVLVLLIALTNMLAARLAKLGGSEGPRVRRATK